MKMVIADPSHPNRLMLSRIFCRLAEQVLQATTGLEALRMIMSDDPDIVIMELDLPVLDGLGVIEAVRSSPAAVSMPIICVASEGRALEIARLQALGVADIILKPARPQDLYDRVQRVLARSAHWRLRIKRDVNRMLLLVDPDPHFVSFATQILQRTFQVTTATNGLEAASTYCDAELKHGIVLCAEHLPTLSETRLLNVIKNLAIAASQDVPQIYLMSESGDVPPEKAMRFDAVLRRSFVPEAFHDEIRRHISKELSAFERLELAMQGDVQAWVSSAMQEALGVMLGQEARRTEPSAAEPFRDAAMSHMELAIDGMDIPLAVDVFCECAAAAKLATNLIGVPLVFEDGGDDVLGELTNTVAGRIVSTLGANGFASRMGLPVTGRAAAERVPSDGGAVWFDAPSVGVFIVRLSVGDVAPAAPGARGGRPCVDGSGPIVDETTEARRALRRPVK